MDARKNFAYSTVATAPSPASSGTSLVVASGDGAKFPSTPFWAVIWPAGTQPTTANAEVVRVTGVSTDTFTIVRAQQGSSARTVVVGDQIAQTLTANDPEIKAFYPIFLNSTRVTQINVSSGTVTFDANADMLLTTAASNASSQAAAAVFAANSNTNFNVYGQNGQWGVGFLLDTIDVNHLRLAVGIGWLPSPLSFTNRHIGFKVINNQLFGTVADGTTEAATAALTTVAQGDYIEVYFKINGTGSVDFYWQKNGAGWSVATTISTNIPSGTNSYQMASFLLDNNGSAATVPQKVYIDGGYLMR